jgi:hypothetical protein
MTFEGTGDAAAGRIQRAPTDLGPIGCDADDLVKT